MTGTIESRLADLVDRFRRARRLPAVGAALVHATGTPVVAVSGHRVRGGTTPVTAADSWHIGSCMKSMTATAVARFVQRGELDWSTPVGDLLPGLGTVHEGWGRVSLADVLTHTAGMPANPTPTELRAALHDPTPAPEQRIRLARQTLSRPPARPGRFAYSNLGYTLVGAALERLTGEPFESVLSTEVLRPLGITGGGFGPPGPDQPWGHRARVVWRGLGIGRGPAIDPASTSTKHPPDNPALITPAGRLHLPLADWAAFVRIFLAGADTPLTPGSLARVTTPPDGVATRQGMGWAVPPRNSSRPRMAYGQQGSNARWVATAVVVPDRTSAALVVCNDGRTRMLLSTLRLALRVLAAERDERAERRAA